jgi:AraC family transcriptional regulator, positive regulator of tynA and feaB
VRVEQPQTAAERWELDARDARDPAEAWREMLARAYVPFDARPDLTVGGPFDARVSRLALGDAALIDFSCGHARGRRTRREISQTPHDLVGILVMRRGSLGVMLGDRSLLLAPGQLVVWDGDVPGSFDAIGPIVKRTLVVPRARLQAAFPRLDDVVGRVLPAGSSVELLSAYLGTLAERGPGLDDAGRAAAGDAAVELARAALGAGLPTEPQRLRETVVLRVREHIELHLRDPGLTPRAIAGAHAISVRTLHEAFEPTGESVGALIRRRRLERCHADLLTPSDDTVTDIARRWGFRDSSYFSRAFRRQYGVAPRELRSARTAPR